MKKVLVLAVAVFALASAAVAGASNGTGNGNGNANKSANGAQTASFSATYDNGVGGHFVCSGEHIAQTAGANGFVKDTEQCTISDPASFFPQGRSVANAGHQRLRLVTLLRHSATCTGSATTTGGLATAITYVVSGGGPDGTAHVSIVAYY